MQIIDQHTASCCSSFFIHHQDYKNNQFYLILYNYEFQQLLINRI